jgi:hypothetical protein
MPANLPPEAIKKMAEVEEARGPQEKIRLLQEFLSLVPKHKGTASTRAQAKRKINALRDEIEEKKRKKGARTGPKIFLEKEGAAQVVLIGLTNVGKSSLLTVVTNAKVEVSPAPYTTREPTPGILAYQDLQFQLVEAPALMEGAADGKAWGLQTLGVARNADGLMLMVDLTQDPVSQLSLVLREMEKARILVGQPKARVEIDRKFMGAGLRIIVFGKLVDCTFGEVEKLLKDYHVTDAVVKISGEAALEDVEEAVFENTVYKPAVVIANKVEMTGAEANLKALEAFVGGRLPIVAISCLNGQGLEKLGEALFKTLRIMRVYTKEPNERAPSKNPFTLRKGATVYDLAKSIHSDFKENFSYAKVWSKRLVFSPQKVGLAFALEDGDVVEIHVK